MATWQVYILATNNSPFQFVISFCSNFYLHLYTLSVYLKINKSMDGKNGYV